MSPEKQFDTEFASENSDNSNDTDFGMDHAEGIIRQNLMRGRDILSSSNDVSSSELSFESNEQIFEVEEKSGDEGS